ncbi:hypothetical protein UMC2_14751 [[Clostridium] sordellii]|nr:hypothetical protein UMC2_14751 [[Clostridium] sordellii] [Paeniclostridium sordellii]
MPLLIYILYKIVKFKKIMNIYDLNLPLKGK